VSAADNIRVVKQMFLALQDSNLTSVMNSFAEDIEWFMPGAEHVPHAGPRHGKQEVAEAFAALAKHVDVVLFEAHEFLGDRDKVVVLGREILRSKATSKTSESAWAMVFTVHKGKITRFREYADCVGMNAAFLPD
jgi:uncharacterized protein